MRKSLAAWLLLSLCSTASMADETPFSPMAGIEIGAMESTFKNAGKKHDAGSETGWGVRGGVQDERSRIYASFHFVDFEESKKLFGQNTECDTDQYDLLLNLEAKSDPFSFSDAIDSFFFVGAHLGGVYVDYKTRDTNHAEETKKSGTEYGFASGAQAGAIVTINKTWEMEAGYRYTWSTLDIDDVDLEHYDNLYIAFTYDF